MSPKSIRAGWIWSLGLILFGGGSCSGAPYRPCSEGGASAAKATPITYGSIKRCHQKKDPQTGQYVNDGWYREWYSNDRIAVEGEFSMGKKTGRWIEYDEKGRKVSDLDYQNGKEVERQ